MLKFIYRITQACHVVERTSLTSFTWSSTYHIQAQVHVIVNLWTSVIIFLCLPLFPVTNIVYCSHINPMKIIMYVDLWIFMLTARLKQSLRIILSKRNLKFDMISGCYQLAEVFSFLHNTAIVFDFAQTRCLSDSFYGMNDMSSKLEQICVLQSLFLTKQ